MSLIAMAVYCTEENGKDPYFFYCLRSIVQTVDLKKHDLILFVNGKTKRTEEIINEFINHITAVFYAEENIGTAKAINKVWKKRQPGENCIKIDDDVVIYQPGWIEEMEEAIRREPQIGIIGLKRKDLMERPDHPDKQFRSELIMLSHIPGKKWVMVERVKHVMGTVQMYNSALLDKIGYLFQPSKYGYDDVLASYRSELSGFINVFLPHINIDHIDPGGTPYQTWKENDAGENAKLVSKIVDEYIAGTRSLYVPCE